MYYRLIHKNTKIQTKWFRVQRIQYWRIFEKYSRDYIVEGREETRSKKQTEQWANYRTLGTIVRVQLELQELLFHKQAPLFTELETKSIYRFLNTLEENIRNQSHSTKGNHKCQH